MSLVTPEQTFLLRDADDAKTRDWHSMLRASVVASRALVGARDVSADELPLAAFDVTVISRPRISGATTTAASSSSTAGGGNVGGTSNTPTSIESFGARERRALGHKRLCFFAHSIAIVHMHEEPTDVARRQENAADAPQPAGYFFFGRSFISLYGCQRRVFFVRVSMAEFGLVDVYVSRRRRLVACAP